MLQVAYLACTFFVLTFGQNPPQSGWMGWMFDNSGGGFQTKTMREIVWPGSNKAGAVFQPSSAAVAASVDPFITQLNALVLANTRIESGNRFEWASRQEKIKTQLDAGSRWLQFDIYKRGASYYPYNGLEGESTTTTATVINAFLTANPREFIVLDCTYYDGPGSPANDSATNAWNTLNAKILPLGHDLSTFTMEQIRTSNAQVILFSKLPRPRHYSVETFLSLPTANSYSSYSGVNGPNVASKTIELLLPRDYSKIQRSFFVGGLGPNQVNFDTRAQLFTDFADYARTASAVLGPTITAYPKLTWNVILVDFIDQSDLWEYAMALNIDLFACSDADPITCPATALVRDSWQETNESLPCQQNSTHPCAKSCGRCSLVGYGGQTCATNTDCVRSECFLRNDANPEAKNHQEPAFCLGMNIIATCNLTAEGSEACNTTLTRSQISGGSCSRCTANFQCQSGFCNLRLGVCEVVPGTNPVNITSPALPPAPAYNRVVSTTAVSFRADIAPLRPGNANADYPTSLNSLTSPPSDFNSFSTQEPYLASIFGFLLIPIISAIVLGIIYLFCYYPWCCCDRCVKQCCCDCFICGQRGTPTHFWVPCGFLFASLVVILWAGLDSQVANADFSTHLVDPQVGLVGEVNNIFNQVTGQLEGLVPVANTVVGQINSTFLIINQAIQQALLTVDRIANVSQALDRMAAVFNGPNATTVEVTVYDPSIKMNVLQSVVCDPCVVLGQQVGAVNSTLQNVVFQAANTISNTISQTSALTDAQNGIQNGLSGFSGVVGNLVQSINESNSTLQPVLAGFVAQEQSRATIFTLVVIGLLVVFVLPPLLGLVLKTKICFKINWFCAMLLGIIFLLFSGFFVFFVVLWADFCVRLDQFEADPFGSQVARQFNLADPAKAPTAAPTTAPNSTGSVFPGINTPSLNPSSFEPVKIVNACFTGENLIVALNLNNLNWDSLRTTIQDTISSVDIAAAFTSQAGQIVSFRDQFTNLDISNAFNGSATAALAVLNTIPICTCPDGSPFTKQTMLSSCGNTSDYLYDVWFNETSVGNITERAIAQQRGQICKQAYLGTYLATQAEAGLTQTANNKVNALKTAADELFVAYDILYDFALLLDFFLREFSCSLNPIFASFDFIIATYGNCGIIGQVYGVFKKLTCVSLFTEMYKIARAMLVIGYMSILVVIFGMMMDDRIENREEQEEGIVAGLAVPGTYGNNPEMEMHGMRERGSVLEPGAGVPVAQEGGYGYVAEGSNYSGYNQNSGYQQDDPNSVRYV